MKAKKMKPPEESMTLQERIDAALRWPERKLLQDCRAELERYRTALNEISGCSRCMTCNRWAEDALANRTPTEKETK